MRMTFKVLAIAVFVVASAASAFAANRNDRRHSQWPEFEAYYTSNGSFTGRDSMVQSTGN
jgi:hypothetical protein